MTHEDGAGRKSTSTTDEKIQQAREMVLATRRVTIDELTSSLQISHGSVHQVIRRELNFRKVYAKWVTKQLTEEHKRKHVKICQTLLNLYNKAKSNFLTE